MLKRGTGRAIKATGEAGPTAREQVHPVSPGWAARTAAQAEPQRRPDAGAVPEGRDAPLGRCGLSGRSAAAGFPDGRGTRARGFPSGHAARPGPGFRHTLPRPGRRAPAVPGRAWPAESFSPHGLGARVRLRGLGAGPRLCTCPRGRSAAATPRPRPRARGSLHPRPCSRRTSTRGAASLPPSLPALSVRPSLRRLTASKPRTSH